MQSNGSSVELSTDDQFLELVCADEDLLRAEFDAIIAAEWPDPPPDGPADASDSGGRPAPWAHAGDARLPGGPQHLGAGGRGRQRSPPRR